MSSADSSEPVIVVHDLVTHYGGRLVLDQVSLEVRRRETLVILGGSGCGKSTLLRHLVGLARPTSGSVRLFGEDICRISESELNRIRRRIGMSFQGSALLNSMTVAENVALPLREHTPLEDSTIRVMARMKLDQVGLAGVDDYLPAQLSGGMKKRAGVARALAMDPEILLFDEPSAGLDPVIAAGIDHLILKLKAAFGVTIVVVTHELASAFLIADRILLLDKGRVVACGTPEEIRASQHPRVRQMLDRQPDSEATPGQAYLDSLFGFKVGGGAKA
jgi:phospholipid/cholesterol/gamma-HCH transport system ATP-binding protein